MVTKQKVIRKKQKGGLVKDELAGTSQRLKMTKKQTKQLSFQDELKKKIVFSIILLGIFSIVAGLGLIVAAYWDVIPAVIKVGGGLALLASSLITTSYFQKQGKSKWAEAFLFISFLFIGGNIALIQQSYHLDLSWRAGSWIWWGLSLPLVFFTRYKLIPLCSVILLGFAMWDIIWDMNYMLVAGLLFVFMMLTHFCDGPKSKFLRKIAFIVAIFFLYAGDMMLNSTAGFVGIITTTLFLIFCSPIPKDEDGIVRYYNFLFLFVAWRIFMLCWNAYYNLTSMGVLLIVFGTILLTGAGLYTYYFKEIQEFIRGFVKHE